MHDVHRGPALGAAGHVVLLVVLQLTVGLDGAGWAAGLVFGAAVALLLARALGHGPLGLANAVTLGRSVLVGGVVALVMTAAHHSGFVTALAATALAFDLVDGRVARRRNEVSELGARFDMEIDAALILVLSVAAVPDVGWWVLAIGLARYGFGITALAAPWLRAPTPPSRWRKIVAAVQGVTLTVAVSGVLDPAVAGLVLAVALVLLAHSFGSQVGWLWTHRAGRDASTVPRHDALVPTLLAFALVWFTLLLPSRLNRLDVVDFARIPVEALAVAGLALVLPLRARRLVAIGAGVLLAASVLLRVLDLGFFKALDRPFNLTTDTGTFGPAVGVLGDSIGHGWAIVVSVAAVALAIATVVVVPLCVVRLSRVAARHRRVTGRVVGVLAVVWVVSAGVGARFGPGEPLASVDAGAPLVDHARAAGAAVEDGRAFARTVRTADAQAGVPAGAVLSKLRGKDVLLVFVESYGTVAVQDSSIAARDDAALRTDTAQLAAAGFGARSAFLSSSTFGGISWLAHASVQSGLWIDSQTRYDELVSSRRYTLSDAFRRAGWRTVSEVPSDTGSWPQGRSFYHYDALYNAENIGYRGPSFGYARIPDQYSLGALRARELASPHRKPVFAEIDLDSSHTPWTPLPSMVPWSRLGDGSVYRHQIAGQPSASEVWSSSARVRSNYARSIRYSLASLVSFVTTSHDPNLVMVLLGDHQPSDVISGSNPGHDVPISLVSADPSVLSAIDGWRWQPGLLPGRDAPVWRMSAFRDRFLDAYSDAPAEVASHTSH